ncbi:gluconate transporter [Janibacter hoylei PVAS-1]|uniref:Gluconate transporter n=1 Tax=Janibacter hoylei PVAS-1 TaxID=1210046 RepID=K1ES06_9MICO|nr:SLC13 family permease [Janibacter hoylei]EKA61983.1 gluconate transporter [Janibacter hoylei PVAS-1]RWU82588.1 gluconate transporter [Janibacter hoylei PVAS-1]
MDIALTLVAIALAIVLILRFKVDPVISLIISSVFLGLSAGVGAADTVAAITTGFGEIMGEVGLLIGFGVLIGSLLQATGTFRALVEVIARRVGRKLPYAMAAALSAVFPSIYVDVQVVLASPMARQAAPVVDRRKGLPWLAGAIGIGIFAGYVFVVPGLAAVAISGQLKLPLGEYLIFGAPIGVATALLTTFLFRLLLQTRFWDERTDVDPNEEEHPDNPGHAAYLARGEIGHESTGSSADADLDDPDAVPERALRLPLLLRLTPILVPLVLIAFGAFMDLFDASNGAIAFVGDANIALFVGLLIAFVIGRSTLGSDGTEQALSGGFRTTGEILLITGIGGSLGAVITETGLDTTLEGLFSADAGAPVLVTVLLAWFIAALLHFAIGSVSVGAITASGIIGPVVASTGVSPVVVALAIASGAMFALHVNSNFFWMFKSLLGLSTKGALKTLTLATSLGAVVSLPMVLLVSLVA